ncbi:competence protein CoiA [Bacillus solitudinis]|uniref:competence protein CoiA n=1 Tax=Bacillus solitudinis TaxID=2014074 RepID=UPI000C24EC74|nr:competence protein CoiA family protein [Bacillus solitudinis]
MLTAKTANGTVVSLGEDWKLEELKNLRNATSFYCQACGASVQLKLGSIKQWHFAHARDKICDNEHEPESEYHLKGKYQLYQWLLSREVKVALEVYLPLIRQRPDILIKHERQLYAIEFQCSSLDPLLLEKRTKGYHEIGITPIWILGGNRLKRHGPMTVTVKSFEWLALREIRSSEKQILYYCPKMSKWITLQQLTPFSTTKSLARIHEQPIDNMSLLQLIDPKLSPPLLSEPWLMLKRHWRYEPPHRYPSKAQKYYQHLLYHQKIPLAKFPIEAGWPTPFFDSIETSPHVWQTILLIECIARQPLHKPFSLQLILSWFHPFINKKMFPLRKNLLSQTYEQAVVSYLLWLSEIGLLSYSSNTQLFVRTRDLQIPGSQEGAQQYEKKIAQSLDRLKVKRGIQLNK